MKYTLKKGEHFSSPRTNLLPLKSSKEQVIEKYWMFDDSVKYQADAENDENKLFGVWFMPPTLWALKNPKKLTRYNCAMVAFRWIEGTLELSPYLHREGSMDYAEKLGNVRVKVPLNQPIHTKIHVMGQLVVFYIEGKTFSFNFPNHCSIAFAIQPYFGGQAVAPHDITIDLLE